ncbi:FAD-dependent oxidoreductase [Fictibacillus aquaticus]|uniref:CoA-disulfide reductase n=1 Tax=Fictibacillus aquaticus TaxID=2021314 RepID=A0A235F8Z6_9BACL|nr:FAD-dependent oxidoreductase [Fictibacillus aquaticus]OYD57417.1 CoA-disulfide reductase [Fictibacillus aquaticus]
MKYCIIGGDAAGMSAAMQIIRHNENADITVFEKGGIYSYGQCGLPYVAGGLIPSAEKLIARSVETFRDKYKIDARTFHEVTGVDEQTRQVTGIHTKTKEPFTFTYDKLLVASGVSPLMPDWNGTHLNGVHVVKTIPDMERLLSDLSDDVREVTIIGGGYIGLEMAENMKHIGKNVRIIQRSSQIAGIFDDDMASLILEEAEKHSIEVCLNEEVLGFKGDDRVQFVKTAKKDYMTDLVIVSVGVTPNTGFLKNSRVKLNDRGVIFVDEFMQTNVEGIYAAGDCATQYHLVKKLDDHIPLGTTANKQGHIAGLNMAGIKRPFKGIVGTSIIQFMDLTLGKTGVSIKEAEKLGMNYDSVTITAKDHAGYYPGAEKMQLKLLFDKDSKKLLGAQIIGKKGVDKRIDVIATALHSEMTIDDLVDLDLSYAPPYNGSWDPVQQAARRVK